MAIKKTIEIDVEQVKAMGGLNALQESLQETEEKSLSLKAELKKLKDQLAQLPEGSAEYDKIAERAGEVSDKVGDINTSIKNLGSDTRSIDAVVEGAQAISGAFSLATSASALLGENNEDLQKTMLKVEAAIGLTVGIQSIANALQQESALVIGLSSAATRVQIGLQTAYAFVVGTTTGALKALRIALISTGIGLLLAAVGTLYAYWDDIKKATSGVSDEQKEQNLLLNETSKKAKEQLSTLNSQDETLKRQGKTEREILELKQKQTQEALTLHINAIKDNIAFRKIQEETAARNKEILKGILDYVAYPIVTILKGIDAIGEKFGKTFGLAEKFKNFTAELLFDPEEVKAKGVAVAKEDQKILAELLNQMDGYTNQINAIDKKAGEDAATAAKKREEERKAELERLYALEQSYLKKLNDAELAALDLSDKIKKENDLNRLSDSEQKKKIEQDDFDLKLAQINRDLVDEDAKKIALEELEINHLNKINDINLESQKVQYDADEKAAEHKRILKEQELALVGQTFGKIAELAGKNSKIGKAFAVGQALINTYQGITAQLSTKPNTPYEIGLVIANVATVAATGFKAVKQILSTNPMSSGGGGGAPSGGASGGGSSTATPQFNLVGQSSTNQLTSTIAGQQNRPVQTFVVGSQVTSQQALDRNAQQNSVFG